MKHRKKQVEPNFNLAFADAPPRPPCSCTDDGMVSRETFDMLKKQLAEQQQVVANLRAHKESVDQASRAFINETIEDSTKYLETISSGLPAMQKQMIGSFHDRFKGMAQAPAEKLDSEMPLAVLVHCASANAREVMSQNQINAAKDEELKKSLSRIEELEADNAKKARQVSEVSALAEERQAQAEELGAKLAAITGAARRYDFSLPSSRHTGLASSGPSATEQAAASLAASHLKAQPAAPSAVTPPVNNGVPTTIATGGNGKAPMAPQETYTSTVYAASAGMGAAPVNHTPDGFASWAMLHGEGGSRVMRSSAGNNSLLGAGMEEPGSSSTPSNFDLSAAIKAASGSSMM